jgi:hypothetical protein
MTLQVAYPFDRRSLEPSPLKALEIWSVTEQVRRKFPSCRPIYCLDLGRLIRAIRKMSVNGMEIVTQWDLDRGVRDGKRREALLASIVERSRPPAARCRIGRQTSGEEAAIQVRSRETKKRHRGSQLCRRRYNGLSVRSRRRCSLPSHR